MVVRYGCVAPPEILCLPCVCAAARTRMAEERAFTVPIGIDSAISRAEREAEVALSQLKQASARKVEAEELQKRTSSAIASPGSSGKKVLIVLTSIDKYPDGSPTGWYLPEAAHPYFKFVEAGIEVEFASITGTATCDPSSVEASKEDAESMKFWVDATLRSKTEKNKKLSECVQTDYDAIFFAGGFGTMWDFPENEAVAKMITETYAANKPVAAVCHGPICFANVKDAEGNLILAGKEVTGFTNAEENAVGKYDVVSTPSGPGSCEDVLGAIGTFRDGGVFQPNVCVADNILTGQNPPSAGPLAVEVVKAIGRSEALIESLKKAGVTGTLLACLDMSDTMVFPFLADFFGNHGVSQSMVGFIFGIMSFGMLVFCPIVPFLMPKIGGPAKTLALGTIMFAAVRIATALLAMLPDGDVMAFAAGVVFLVTGFVYAFTEIGGLTWVLATAPEGKKSTAMATLMSARMAGALLGTPVGGVLFDLIGWIATNIVCALILIIPLAFFSSTLLQPVVVKPESKSKLKVWTDPKFVLANAFGLVAISGMYAYVPYLQPWFAQSFGMSKSVFGIWSMVLIVTGFMGGSGVSGPPPFVSAVSSQPLRFGCVACRRLQCTFHGSVMPPPPRSDDCRSHSCLRPRWAPTSPSSSVSPVLAAVTSSLAHLLSSHSCRRRPASRATSRPSWGGRFCSLVTQSRSRSVRRSLSNSRWSLDSTKRRRRFSRRASTLRSWLSACSSAPSSVAGAPTTSACRGRTRRSGSL